MWRKILFIISLHINVSLFYNQRNGELPNWIILVSPKYFLSWNEHLKLVGNIYHIPWVTHVRVI